MERRRIDIIYGGTGGQGIVLAGYITGKAAAVHENLHSVFIPSYGAEARGGKARSCIAISNEKIDYPYVWNADIMMIMSQQAYDAYISMLKKNGILIVDEDLVKLDDRAKHAKVYKIPATRIAERLGHRIVANIVMLGFIVGITKIVSFDSMKKSVEESVPKRFLELNLKALKEGYDYAKKFEGVNVWL